MKSRFVIFLSVISLLISGAASSFAADKRPLKSVPGTQPPATSAPAVAVPATPTAPTPHGAQFISTEGPRLLPSWSAAFRYQTISANSSKGWGFEIITPSVLYGRAAIRTAFTTNSLLGITQNQLAANPGGILKSEYRRFDIVNVDLLIPFVGPSETLTPYLGAGVNVILADDDVADSRSQVTFALMTGVNLRFGGETGPRSWGSFFEFGTNTKNAEADKLLFRPSLADGFVTRAGFRVFF